MKRVVFGLCFCAAFAGLSEDCLAHRVNVFAFVDGDQIHVEASFGRQRKVKHGTIIVSDLETGEILVEGVTDEQGVFRFRPPEAFLQAGHGLNIRLDAGEGHRDDWKIPAEDLRALSSPSASRKPPDAAAAPPHAAGQTGIASSPPDCGRDMEPVAVDVAMLEAMVAKTLDEKLAPIKAALASQRDAEPGLRDIIGGIGWIVGLLGIATYMKYRR